MLRNFAGILAHRNLRCFRLGFGCFAHSNQNCNDILLPLWHSHCYKPGKTLIAKKATGKRVARSRTRKALLAMFSSLDK